MGRMEAVGAKKSEGLKVDVPSSHDNRTGGSGDDFQTCDVSPWTVESQPETSPMCIWDMDWLIEKSDLACYESTHHLPHTHHGQTHCIIPIQVGGYPRKN